MYNTSVTDSSKPHCSAHLFLSVVFCPNLVPPNPLIPQQQQSVMIFPSPQHPPEQPFNITFVDHVGNRGNSVRGHWGIGTSGGRITGDCWDYTRPCHVLSQQG